jgi:Tol biopolymer transport system component
MAATESANVRAQLSRILSSSAFVNSPRMTRFLKFVVETALEGKGPRIKEYVIAVEVFEKADSYDPQADSTVRTEASKLRAKLTRYYETEGRKDPLVITIPKGSYVPAFADRRKKTVFRSPRAATVLATAGLTAAGGIAWLSRFSHSSPPPALVQVTSYPGLEQQPSLSPDGLEVAFRWKNDIYVKQVASESYVQVTKDPAVDSWPAWSPDGSQIAFVRDGNVYFVPSLGGAERMVAKSAGRVVWMPDGSSILVLEKTSPYARSVFRVSVATGEKRRLTFPNDLSPGDVDMAVSPDGRTIAVCRTVTDVGCDLYLVPATGGEAGRLTNDQRGIQGFTWTSDGREIIFASNRQGWFRLWRVAAHPLNSPLLYRTPVLVEGAGDDVRMPSISRGDRLVYQRHTRNFDISRAEIAGVPGTKDHRLWLSTPLIASTRLDVSPSWSPDTSKIAFVSDRSGARELWICDADGSNPLKLTSFAGPAVIYPRWSPDGQRLVFSALTSTRGNFEGYTIDAKGGMPVQLRVGGHPSIAHPVYSRDGRWLFFIPGPEERAVEVWRVPAAGGEAVQLTNHGAFRPEISPDGNQLFYGKYGTHGLWSVPIAGGQERKLLDSITENHWTVALQGIYYIDFGTQPGAPKLLKFYSFQTGKTNQVGLLEPTVSGDYSGISVSSDGHWLLYSYIADVSSDLMMVDHFR